MMVSIYVIKKDKKGNYYILKDNKKVYIEELKKELKKNNIKYTITKNSMFFDYGYIKIGG